MPFMSTFGHENDWETFFERSDILGLWQNTEVPEKATKHGTLKSAKVSNLR